MRVAENRMSEDPTTGEVIVARGITKSVLIEDAMVQILAPTDLSLKQGSSLAITGPSGSGKTTLLSILAGLDKPTDGEVWMSGHPLHTLHEDQVAKIRGENVGFVFQDHQLIDSLSAVENVMLPAIIRGTADARDQALNVLSQVGLSHRISSRPHSLSGGERQRVALARALVHQPRIIFGDEPTGSLDRNSARMVIDLLLQTQELHDVALLMVTHDEQIAKRCQQQITIQ